MGARRFEFIKATFIFVADCVGVTKIQGSLQILALGPFFCKQFS